jgi:hypothetical protein
MFAEDADIFFQEFAVEGETVGETPRTFRAILTDDLLEVDGVIKCVPTCRIKTSDADGLKIRSEIRIDGRSFAVVDRNNDGTGMTDMILREL